eukprot:CAMPEP_0196779058 /NCGR_PEP_ID=MMETSP1104-20130614/6158_1 /TAXON_ID=33652 /ORGANISM="Cafeteria sp., Strain Caron Lab Isolate" /LENGTH=111 /DNA_ID=CAMNT_0042149233 /DNA_START=78 /DNA_END=413 /DNA_ORIENTATION=+
MSSTSGEPVRLYVKGVVVSYKRSKVVQYNHTNLIKIQGVNQRSDTDFYLGKRVAYIYKAPVSSTGPKFRCIWGKVTRAHGNGGVVRAKFQHNLPTRALGAPVRIMLYPSRV